MLDAYVYYPRRVELTTPRRVGQVTATAPYSGDAADASNQAPGETAGGGRRLPAGAARESTAPPDQEGARDDAGRGDDDDDSGGHVDTFA
ncbi:MAG: hypothetical protein R6V11_08935 [Ectothiorhodospiraceae bacterium]